MTNVQTQRTSRREFPLDISPENNRNLSEKRFEYSLRIRIFQKEPSSRKAREFKTINDKFPGLIYSSLPENSQNILAIR